MRGCESIQYNRVCLFLTTVCIFVYSIIVSLAFCLVQKCLVHIALLFQQSVQSLLQDLFVCGCLIRICFGKFNLHSTLARSFVLFLIWCSFAMFLYFAKRNLYWLDSQAGLSVCLFYFCNFVKCCTLQFGILWGFKDVRNELLQN